MIPRVYLAGPEVFLPNADDILARKCDMTRAAGLEPLAPGDADVPDNLPLFDKGLHISGVDEDLMLASDAIIANLTPFRGVSADVGTAYELGFMAARGKALFAYTNDARPHFDRVQAEHLIVKTPDGHARDAKGLRVEGFDMADNLMLQGGVQRRGQPLIIQDADGDIADLRGFEKALALAVKALR